MILAQNSVGGSSVTQFVTVLIIFILVLTLTYFTTRWVAGYQKGKMMSGNFEVIETFKVTTNKYLQIVRVGSKYLAIAICKDSVTLLTELSEEDIKIPEPGQNNQLDFKQILEKAQNLKNKK